MMIPSPLRLQTPPRRLQAIRTTMRRSASPSLLLPLLPYKTTPRPSRLLPLLQAFASHVPPLSLLPTPLFSSPTPNSRVAPTVPFSSGRSKMASSSISGKGLLGSKRDEFSVALGGVGSGEPLESDEYEREFPPLGASTGSQRKGCGRRRVMVDLGLDQSAQTMLQDASPSESKNSQSRISTNRVSFAPSGRNHRNLGDNSRNQIPMRRTHLPFDICIPEDGGNVGVGMKLEVLRPGMVLLKHYLTHDEQVDVIKTCRRLGVGPGGFYRPGYRDGSKLRLQMMCLGLNWDPETKYRANLAGMDRKPPKIPDAFIGLVERAIKDAHALMNEDSGAGDAESVIPRMSPDICIVNFYSATGRLGLHQDRDESRGSIGKGLPIVSFSIGDSGEFLYGETRDVERAERVILESGDVLIFGGESRLVFHGLNSLIPNSAPKRLLHDSKLRRPGRLNLTFRKF